MIIVLYNYHYISIVNINCLLILPLLFTFCCCLLIDSPSFYNGTRIQTCNIPNDLAGDVFIELNSMFIVCITIIIVSIVGTSNGPIRLWRNGGTSPAYTSGRVQLYFNNRWGNICDDIMFGLTEATVICHQLGYTGASSQSRDKFDR